MGRLHMRQKLPQFLWMWLQRLVRGPPCAPEFYEGFVPNRIGQMIAQAMETLGNAALARLAWGGLPEFKVSSL